MCTKKIFIKTLSTTKFTIKNLKFFLTVFTLQIHDYYKFGLQVNVIALLTSINVLIFCTMNFCKWSKVVDSTFAIISYAPWVFWISLILSRCSIWDITSSSLPTLHVINRYAEFFFNSINKIPMWEQLWQQCQKNKLNNILTYVFASFTQSPFFSFQSYIIQSYNYGKHNHQRNFRSHNYRYMYNHSWI